MVHLLVIAVLDQVSLPDGDGRVILNGSFQQLVKVGQRVQVFRHLMKLSLGELQQNVLNVGQILKGSFKGDQVSGIGGPVTDLHGQPFQIIDRIHVLPEFLPGHGIVFQHLHRIQPAVDITFGKQGLLDHLPEHPGSHGGPGAVQDPEQTAFFIFFTESLRQFQIPSGRTVENHKAVCLVEDQVHQVGQGVLLGLMQVTEEGAAGDRLIGQLSKPHLFQILLIILGQDLVAAVFRNKIAAVKRSDHGTQFLLQVVRIDPGDQQRIVAKDLCRLIFVQLIHEHILPG